MKWNALGNVLISKKALSMWLDNSELKYLHNKTLLNQSKIDRLLKKVNIEKIYLSNIEDKFNSNIKYWSSIPSRMPMDIKRGIYISSYYGYRDDHLMIEDSFMQVMIFQQKLELL